MLCTTLYCNWQHHHELLSSSAHVFTKKKRISNFNKKKIMWKFLKLRTSLAFFPFIVIVFLYQKQIDCFIFFLKIQGWLFRNWFLDPVSKILTNFSYLECCFFHSTCHSVIVGWPLTNSSHSRKNSIQK